MLVKRKLYTCTYQGNLSGVVFSVILIDFWMPTIMKNIFDVAVYQKLHYG